MSGARAVSDSATADATTATDTGRVDEIKGRLSTLLACEAELDVELSELQVGRR